MVSQGFAVNVPRDCPVLLKVDISISLALAGLGFVNIQRYRNNKNYLLYGFISSDDKNYIYLIP